MNNLKAYLVYKGLISARWFDLVSSMEEKSNLLWRSFFFSWNLLQLRLSNRDLCWFRCGSNAAKESKRVKSFNFYRHNKCFPSLEHTQELGRSYYCEPCWGLDLQTTGFELFPAMVLSWFLPGSVFLVLADSSWSWSCSISVLRGNRILLSCPLCWPYTDAVGPLGKNVNFVLSDEDVGGRVSQSAPHY